MRKTLFFVVLMCIISGCNSRKVDFGSLLNEMNDRSRFALYPDKVDYRLMQATGYDRQDAGSGVGSGAFIRQETNVGGATEWVLMEDKTAGAIVNMWTVCFNGNPSDTIGGTLSIYLDGENEPAVRADFFELLKGNGFVKAPFAQKSGNTANLYLPIPYSKGCKVTLDREPFYYRIAYRSYGDSIRVKSFSMKDFEAEQKLLAQTGAQLVSPSPVPAHEYIDRKVDLAPKTSAALELPFGSYAVYNMKIKLHTDGDLRKALRSTILSMTFDSLETVWAPLGDFFANGVGLKPYSMWDKEVRSDTTFVCRFVMPYRSFAVMRLQNPSDQAVTADVSLDISRREWTWNSLYFFANWLNTGPIPTSPVHDIHHFLAYGTGYYLGNNLTVLNPLSTWEGFGPEKIFIDENPANVAPSFMAAAPEDYYNGVDYMLKPSSANEFSGPFYSELYFGTTDDPAREKLKSSLSPLGYTTVSRIRSLDAIRFDHLLNMDYQITTHKQVPWIHLQYDIVSFFYADSQTAFPMMKDPAAALKKVLTASDLDSINRSAREKFILDKSLVEGGQLKSPVMKGVQERPVTETLYPVLSGGDARYFNFEKPDGSLSFRLAGYSASSRIEVDCATGPQMGSFEVFVNGSSVGTIDLTASSDGVRKVNLGYHTPVNGVFDIRIDAKGGKADTGLLIDYFWIKEAVKK